MKTERRNAKIRPWIVLSSELPLWLDGILFLFPHLVKHFKPGVGKLDLVLLVVLSLLSSVAFDSGLLLLLPELAVLLVIEEVALALLALAVLVCALASALRSRRSGTIGSRRSSISGGAIEVLNAAVLGRLCVTSKISIHVEWSGVEWSGVEWGGVFTCGSMWLWRD